MLKIKSQKGFTIVELLIVIVVIGILAALVLNTFNGVQKRARDTQRQNAVNSMSTQLEAYYTDHGSYPALADLKSQTWVKANLKGFDTKALFAPGKPNGDSDTPTYVTGTAANKDQFGYDTTASCTSPTDDTGTATATAPTTPCVFFTLSWWKEDGAQTADPAVQKKASLNN